MTSLIVTPGTGGSVTSTVCKSWRRDTEEFNGLCSQEYQPMTGTDECPVCITPVDLLPPTGCGACDTTEVWPNTYRLAKPFNVSGASLEGGHFGTGITWTRNYSGNLACVGKPPAYYNSIEQQRSHYYYFAGYGWDDLARMSAQPLIRNEQDGLNNNCQPDCYWSNHETKLVFIREYPSRWGIFDCVPQCVGNTCPYTFPGHGVEQWITTKSHKKHRSKRVDYNCFTYGDVHAEHLMSDTLYTPDISYRWPQSFGTLAGKPIGTQMTSLYRDVLSGPVSGSATNCCGPDVQMIANCTDIWLHINMGVAKAGDKQRFGVGISAKNQFRAGTFTNTTWKLNGNTVNQRNDWDNFYWCQHRNQQNCEGQFLDSTSWLPDPLKVLSPIAYLTNYAIQNIYSPLFYANDTYSEPICTWRSAWVPCSKKTDIECFFVPTAFMPSPPPGLPTSITLIGQ